MKRLEYGAYKKMTPEQQAAHRRAWQKQWRDNNKALVSERNHYWFERYKRTKPFIATCIFCGKRFNATRKYYKTCPECRDERHTRYVTMLKERKMRVAEKEEFYKDIMRLNKLGLKQTDIAAILNTTQSAVSYILRTRNKDAGNK